MWMNDKNLVAIVDKFRILLWIKVLTHASVCRIIFKCDKLYVNKRETVIGYDEKMLDSCPGNSILTYKNKIFLSVSIFKEVNR